MTQKPLTPEDIANIISNSPDRPKPGDYDLLVSLVGLSPNTPVQAYLVLRPKKLYLLCSRDTVDKISYIKSEITRLSTVDIDQSDFDYIICQPADPVDIFHKIKEKIDDFKNQSAGENPPRVAIDITGGKKVMSAAAALAAWQLNMEIVYGDNVNYNADARGPEKQNETGIISLENPNTLFCEQEEAKINALFNKGQFRTSIAEYSTLSKNVSRSHRTIKKAWIFTFKSNLATLYAAWCDMDRKGVGKALNTLAGLDFTKLLRPKQITALKKQMDFLREFASDEASPTIGLLNFYLLGQHYLKNGRRDFASLLFYRCLEGTVAARLEGLFPGFKCGKPDYALLGRDINTIKEEYANTSKDLPGTPKDSLPDKVAFMDAAILLNVLNDPLSKVDAVINLQSVGTARNESILAHGDKNIKEEHCLKLQKSAEDMLKTYLSLREDAAYKSLGQAAGELAFIQFEQ
jgi:hypothetical protein